jgi:hypothetical protein
MSVLKVFDELHLQRVVLLLVGQRISVAVWNLGTLFWSEAYISRENIRRKRLFREIVKTN